MNLLNRKLGAAALVVGVACLGLADPAFAGTDIKVHTTDTSPGGIATFKSKGDKLIVCDVQTDGYAVAGGLIFNGKNHGYLEDWSTNGKCASASVSGLPQGKPIKLQVCLMKGGKYYFCSKQKAGTT